jgi:tellurite resistance protein TerC
MGIASVGSPLLWVAFTVFVLAMLALDLGVFHRTPHAISAREAAGWSVFWISLALLFGVFIHFKFGSHTAVEYLTGYVIEKALSVDNIFVILVIMSFFAVPREFQHKVLFWGIIGALVMRALFIFAGAALLQRFHWVMYVFGVFLFATGVKLMVKGDEEVHPDQNIAVRLLKRFVPVSSATPAVTMTVREEGKLKATHALLALVTIEATDVVFALDSIPAIFAVTQDPFIVYTSNIFAILGLRSLYFLLSGAFDKFKYLKVGLALVLVFVGLKMLVSSWIKIPALLSLAVILAFLFGSIAASAVESKVRIWRAHARGRHHPPRPGA